MEDYIKRNLLKSIKFIEDALEKYGMTKMSQEKSDELMNHIIKKTESEKITNCNKKLPLQLK